uniref:Putative secreted metalloprotease n=1 Tax=Ixodes ricinus TaxID=34613 RepID=A0A147BHX7_IXORI
MLRAKSLFIMLAFTHGISGSTDEENRPSIKLGVHFLCDTSFVENRMKKPSPNSSVLTYLNVMLHTAEVYFRDLECPDIELYLVGLDNTTKQEEEEFEVTETVKPNIIHMDGPFTLAFLQEWVEKSGKFNESDIVILLTKRIIVDYIGNPLFGLAAGVSYLDGICSPLHVGMVYDTGRDFWGIRSLIQQIAHLLGAPWDEGYQAPNCLSKEGHLMSIRSVVSLYPTLSNCTKDYLLQKYQENLHTKPCWMDTPKPIVSRTKNLPVHYFEKEEFCKSAHPWYPEGQYCPNDHPAQNKTPICNVACCMNETTFSGFYSSTPDGTNCTDENGGDDGKVCLFSKCVTR